jgi:hypothetical protein
MSSFSSDIEKIVNKHVINFFNGIKEKFSDSLDENGDALISLNDIIDLWNSEGLSSEDNGSSSVESNVSSKSINPGPGSGNPVLGSCNPGPGSGNPVLGSCNPVLGSGSQGSCSSTKKNTESKNSKPIGSAASNASNNGCQYVNIRGDNKGKLCGGKVSQSSTSGKYCSKHLKEEKEEKSTNSEKKSPAKEKTVKKQKDDFTSSTKEELKQKIEERKSTIPITRNKWGNYEHPDTNIVLDKETHMAYGKQNSDGKIIPLSAEDIEMCKILNFKYKLPESISSSKKIEYESDEDEDIYDDEDEIDEDELED